jgi:lipopolysaccharide/colanic/teichoic acid biosynthesis glycosyltransferase
MIRFFDLFFSFLGLLFGLPILVTIYILGLFDTGSPLFFQERVGQHQKSFILIKFRTMNKETVSIASHLVASKAVTPLGKILRKTKIDELPQLWNVLKGEMSLVGPRPNLFNQTELIAARAELGVFNVRPGITGLAQIKNIDMSTPQLLASIDKIMIDSMSIPNYFKFIVVTIFGKGSGDVVRHESD